jgi:hypothetical protein
LPVHCPFHPNHPNRPYHENSFITNAFRLATVTRTCYLRYVSKKEGAEKMRINGLATAAVTIIAGLSLSTGIANAATHNTETSTVVRTSVAAPARPAALAPTTIRVKGLNPSYVTQVLWADGTSDYAFIDYAPQPPTRNAKNTRVTPASLTITMTHTYTTAGAYTVTIIQSGHVVDTHTVLVSMNPELGTPPLA